jgi:hypothetical protein
MRKLTMWGLPAALIVGLGAAVALAGEQGTEDSDAKQPARPFIRWSPWVTRMMATPPPTQRAPAPKPKPKPEKQTAKKAPPPSKPTPVVQQAAGERAREEAALMRRLEVCDKLTEIAVRTNDTELLHRAEQLDERVRTTYSRRTSSLPVEKGAFQSDKQVLDKHLGQRSDAKKRDADAFGYAVPGNDRRAAAKEVP